MKEVVTCDKNLRPKSLLKVNRPLELLKHVILTLSFFEEEEERERERERERGGGGGGGDTYLKCHFQDGRVTKILNLP